MRILMVGELNGYVTQAAQIAIRKGAKVSHVPTLEKALHNLRTGKGADLILVDVNLSIKKFFEDLEKERIVATIVSCGVNANPEQAEESIREGAKEYLPLPPDADLIAAVIAAVCDDNIQPIYKDPIMVRVIRLAEKIAPSDASVLITGESGTGKEVIAHYIHQKSKRSQEPFISINCAAIPENLLETELFGHEKGAFTGAVAKRIGKFEEANGGTLLLDEVSEMHPRLQAKLLRSLQEKVIDRVGGNKSIPVDIRILATSNRDLLQAVKNQEFREDLYFRLNVVNLQMPALRKRKEDIIVLAKYFISKYAKINQVEEKHLDASAIRLLKTYDWPGNVRQLENMMHRSLILSSGERISEEDFEDITQYLLQEKEPENAPVLVGRTVADVEKELIINTLQHCFGNRTHAANILGISIRTLRNKLKEYTQESNPLTAREAS